MSLLANRLEVLVGEILKGAVGADRHHVQPVVGREDLEGGVHNELYTPSYPFPPLRHQSIEVLGGRGARIRRHHELLGHP